MRTLVRVGGRVAGHVEGSTFYRVVRPSHILKHPPALCQDVAVLEQARALGAVDYVAAVTGSGVTYTTLLATFWERGFELDRGYGRQLALPLSAFFVTTLSQPGLPGLGFTSSSSSDSAE